jgi:hypothetical protein
VLKELNLEQLVARLKRHMVMNRVRLVRKHPGAISRVLPSIAITNRPAFLIVERSLIPTQAAIFKSYRAIWHTANRDLLIGRCKRFLSILTRAVDKFEQDVFISDGYVHVGVSERDNLP